MISFEYVDFWQKILKTFQDRIDTNSNVEISKLESQPFEAQSIWESWSIVYWITDRIRIQDSEPALELMSVAIILIIKSLLVWLK